MRNRIKLLFNSVVSMIAMLIIVCCLNTMEAAENNIDMEVVMAMVAGACFIVWMLWAAYMLLRSKEVKEMPAKSRFVMEVAICLLFGFWLYMKVSLIIFSIVWIPFMMMTLTRSFKEAFRA